MGRWSGSPTFGNATGSWSGGKRGKKNVLFFVPSQREVVIAAASNKKMMVEKSKRNALGAWKQGVPAMRSSMEETLV